MIYLQLFIWAIIIIALLNLHFNKTFNDNKLLDFRYDIKAIKDRVEELKNRVDWEMKDWNLVWNNLDAFLTLIKREGLNSNDAVIYLRKQDQLDKITKELTEMQSKKK